MAEEGTYDKHLNILVPSRTVDSFRGNYARALLFIDRYALRTRSGELLEFEWSDAARRIARTAANSDNGTWSESWYNIFADMIEKFDFVPAGRIIAGAGSERDVTLFNCFVLGIDDSRQSITGTLDKAIEIQARGGGVGFNFSNLRPKGSKVYSVGGTASGPVSFVSMYNASFRTISQGGSRRGANMGILSVHHPDIVEFIKYKFDNQTTPNGTSRSGDWEMFNVSVAIDNDFISAIDNDLDWTFSFEGQKYNTIKARELWGLICKYAWLYGDPGIINIENINKDNPGNYFEYLEATNPCSEIPLPRNAVCNLGSINLGNFVLNGYWDWEKLAKTVEAGVRFLDNILDVPGAYPFEEIKVVSQNNRRIGLSTIGIADALIKMRLRYGSKDAISATSEVSKFICEHAYRYSIKLAEERGPFPKCDKLKHSQAQFVQKLPSDIALGISKHGIRNVCMLTGVPGGSISILAGASSGIEPVFAFEHWREDGTGKHKVYHQLAKEWMDLNSGSTLPDFFADASQVSPLEHADMQVAFQNYIDNAISKTINLPNSATEQDVSEAFMSIARRGKSVTVFRDGSRSAVLTREENESPVITPTSTKSKPLTPRILGGHRFKIRSTQGNYYITLTCVDSRGKLAPYECFIQNLDGNNFEWLSSISLLVTAILKQSVHYGTPTDFLVEDLRKIQSPTSAFWMETSNGTSVYMPSIPAAICHTLDEYIEMLGQKKAEILEDPKTSDKVSVKIADYCPECGHKTYVRVGNCFTCYNYACNASTCK